MEARYLHFRNSDLLLGSDGGALSTVWTSLTEHREKHKLHYISLNL